MWSTIKDFLFEKNGQPSGSDGKHSHDEMHIAAAALLVEAALLDGEFGEDERSQIVGNCIRFFDMDPDEANSLVDEAQRRAEDAVDIHGYIRQFAPHFDKEERIKLLEMMWVVVYADGELHEYEANLIRRVTGILGIPDKENGDARKRALARLELNPS